MGKLIHKIDAFIGLNEFFKMLHQNEVYVEYDEETMTYLVGKTDKFHVVN